MQMALEAPRTHEHDSSYSRKDQRTICCLLVGICFALIGICFFYYHSRSALLSEVNKLERVLGQFNNMERDKYLLKFELLMMKPSNDALIDNSYFNIRSGHSSGSLIHNTYDWNDWIMIFFS